MAWRVAYDAYRNAYSVNDATGDVYGDTGDGSYWIGNYWRHATLAFLRPPPPPPPPPPPAPPPPPPPAPSPEIQAAVTQVLNLWGTTNSKGSHQRVIRDMSDKADHVPVDAINTFDPALRLRYAIDILNAGTEAQWAFSKAGFGGWETAISPLRRLSEEAARVAPEWVSQPLNYDQWASYGVAEKLGFRGAAYSEIGGANSSGDWVTALVPTPEFVAFVDRARAAGFDFVEKTSNFHYYNNWFGFRLPSGQVVGQNKTGDDDDIKAFFTQFVIPAFSIAGGFGFVGSQIAAATGLPAIAAEGIARVAVTAASGGDVERAVLGIVVPQVVQTIIPTPDLLDTGALVIEPELLDLPAPVPIAEIAETVAPPVSVFEDLYSLTLPQAFAPQFEPLPEPVFEPVFAPLPEPPPDLVFEAPPEPVFELFPEPLPEPVFEAPPEPVFEFVPEPLPELVFEPTIPEPQIEVPMWDDPFDLPPGYDSSFDPWTFELPPSFDFGPVFDDPFTLPPDYDVSFDPYVEPLPVFQALPDIPVSDVAPLTPDAIASVEGADFASPADLPVSTVRPPVAEEWTVSEAIKDATAAMVAAAGLVVAFNRLRDAAGGGAVNATASARTGTGAQVQARDDGLVWTRDPQGRVTPSRPATGLLQMTTTGNAIINNGNGTYTLIRPDGSRSTLRYPGTVGAGGAAAAALANLPAWAPWALAGGAALLLVAGRRR